MPGPIRRATKPRERPRLAVDVSFEQVRAGVTRAELIALATYVLTAERVRDAMVSVALVTPRAIAALNRRHLGHRGATDVISFGLRPHGSAASSGRGSAVVGDIYVCPGVARVHARRFGVAAREELKRLVVHGTLHVLGWTHPEHGNREASPMWDRQERLLRTWNRRRAR